MQREEFEKWLNETKGLDDNTIRSRVGNCATIDKKMGDLDTAYSKDGCRDFLEKLCYTTDDERKNLPARHPIPITGSIRNGTATYKSALNLYVAFKNGAAFPLSEKTIIFEDKKKKHFRRRTDINNLTSHESYQEFFDEFGISIAALCEFGKNHIETATAECAREQWNDLKNCLLEGKTFTIGATGRTNYNYLSFRSRTQRDDRRQRVLAQEQRFYMALYKDLFRPYGNTKNDGNGNDFPKRFIERATGYRLDNEQREGTPTLIHYTISHIWGERTKNPLLFSALWNIALTPSIIDPFTDEAATGMFANEIKGILKNIAFNKFGSCIEDYNKLLENLKISEKIKNFSCDDFDGDELARLKEQALRQWAPITM